METAKGYLKRAIQERLDGDDPLVTKVGGRIYQFMNPESQFPYVVHGEYDTDTWNSIGRQGEEFFVTIHIFSLYDGSMEADDIEADILRLLGNVDDIVLEKHCFQNSFLDNSNEVIDVDHEERARHHILVFRILVRFEEEEEED